MTGGKRKRFTTYFIDAQEEGERHDEVRLTICIKNI